MAFLTLLAVVLAIPATIAAAPEVRGSISIEEGSGVITIRGRGALLGKLARGQVTVVDLSPLDAWTPRVNGVTRLRTTVLRGRDVNVYVPGGRYRIMLRGEGINVSVRGSGVATLDGEPDVATGFTGTYWVGDDEPQPLPDTATTVAFGER